MDLNVIAHLPPEILETIPLATPPAGTSSNFINPQSSGFILTTVTSIFLVFQVIIFAARIYTRAFIARKLRWDDITCGLGLAFSLAFYIICVIAVKTAYFGTHSWDVNVYQAMNSNIFILGILQQFVYPFAMAFIKLTLFLLYWEIFSPSAWARYAIWFGASASSVFYVICIILHAVFSIPRKGQTYFTHSITKPEHQDFILGVPEAVVSAAIDIYILLLPQFGIWKLQLSTKKKIGISCIFLTGLMACLCSLLILYYRVIALYSADTLRILVPVLTTSVLESQIGVICCCMPILPMLVRRIRAKPRKQTTTNSYNSYFRSKRTRPSANRPNKYSSIDEPITLNSIYGQNGVAVGGLRSVETRISNGNTAMNGVKNDGIHLTKDFTWQQQPFESA